MENSLDAPMRARSGPMRGAVMLLVALAALLVMASGASAKKAAKQSTTNCGVNMVDPAPGCEPASLTLVKEVAGVGEGTYAFPMTVAWRTGGWYPRDDEHGEWHPPGKGWQSVDPFTLTVPGDASKTIDIPMLRGGVWVSVREDAEGWRMADVSCESNVRRGRSMWNESNWRRDGEGFLIRVKHGESLTCTLTNRPATTVLHLVKHVKGGPASASDFTLMATGTIEDNAFSGMGTAHSPEGLKPDTFTLSEEGPSGYRMGRWMCTSDEHGWSDHEDRRSKRHGRHHDEGWWKLKGNMVTVGEGAEVWCHITNRYKGEHHGRGPALHLMKEVVNDNGGTATAGDFTLTATGPTTFSGAGTAHSPEDFERGTYVLSESGPAGYQGAWECVGFPPGHGTHGSPMKGGGWWGDQKNVRPWVVTGGDTIVLKRSDEVWCRAVNDDIAPSLTITKVVVNNDAGTSAASDFTLTATGASEGNAFSGLGPVVASGGTLRADTFTLSETGPAGYAASWVCVGGTLTGDTIPLAIGQTASCTVTNDDIGPTPPVTPVTPVAPGAQPVIAPPVSVRGTVRLAGPRGCVQPGAVISRVSGQNIATVRFYRDGRLVKTANVNSPDLRVVTLSTRLRAADHKAHVVTARVQFVQGATPTARTVTHRFRVCRQAVLPPVISAVTG